MIGNATSLGTFFTSVSGTTQAITPVSNLVSGQVVYIWVFAQSTLGGITVTGGSGQWATDVPEFAEGANCFGQLLRHVVPPSEVGTAPTWTTSWGASHTATWDVFGLTGAHPTKPTLAFASTSYTGAGTPRTGPTLTPTVGNCRLVTCYGETATSASANTNSGATWTRAVTQFQTQKSTLVDYTSNTVGVSAANDTSTWGSTNLGISVIFAVQPPPANLIGPGEGLGLGLGS